MAGGYTVQPSSTRMISPRAYTPALSSAHAAPTLPADIRAALETLEEELGPPPPYPLRVSMRVCMRACAPFTHARARAQMHGQQACMMYIQVIRAKHSTHIGEEHPAQRRSDESTVIAPRLAAPQPEAGLF